MVSLSGFLAVASWKNKMSDDIQVTEESSEDDETVLFSVTPSFQGHVGCAPGVSQYREVAG